MSTVSKTTHEIVQVLRSGYFSPGDVLEACLKLEALALRSDLSEHDLSLAQQATAELQKENARLTKALYEFFQLAAPHVGIAARSKMWAALNPPNGGAVQKGLSKEKAK